MKFLVVSLFSLVLSSSNCFSLECPKMPEQTNKDWDLGIGIAIGRIGPAKGTELKTRTKAATKDLLGKLPEADRLYLEQMMYATYCSGLKADKTLTETEKTKRIGLYNETVRKAFSNSQNKVNVKEHRPKSSGSAKQPQPSTPLPASPSVVLSQLTQMTPTNSNISFGPVGGDLIQTVNITDLPKPQFRIKSIKENFKVLGSYESEYLLNIDSKFPLKKLFVEINFPHILLFEVHPTAPGMSTQTIPEITSEIASQIFFDASGEYNIKIVTGTPFNHKVGIGYK